MLSDRTLITLSTCKLRLFICFIVESKPYKENLKMHQEGCEKFKSIEYYDIPGPKVKVPMVSICLYKREIPTIVSPFGSRFYLGNLKLDIPA